VAGLDLDELTGVPSLRDNALKAQAKEASRGLLTIQLDN
jgi:hypothetical protein